MNESHREVYRSITGPKYGYLLGSLLLLAGVFVLDVFVGPSFLSAGEVWHGLIGDSEASSSTHVILWVIRLPAACMALAVGASLGMAGAEMQTILDNPLASPYTLGISAAAGFGAALAIVLNIELVPFLDNMAVSLNAFLFALLCCGILYVIARYKSASAETMILSGVALLFMFNAMLALLQYLASDNQLQAVVFWLFGSLNKSNWYKVSITSAVLLVTTGLFLRNVWPLTALRLGDQRARSLGVDVEGLRIRTLVYISILTATAVCFVGIIGFVGLGAPHIARIFVGEDQRFFLPLSGLIGAILLSLASIGSKLIIPGAIFPIGILTATLGAPFFLLLVLFSRRSFW